jgi:cobalamin biosynthesis protein CbiG
MKRKNRRAVITITESGAATAGIVVNALRETDHLESRGKENSGRLPELTRRAWEDYNGLIFIMATGIVVRMIAPLVKDKYHDPAVVVVDDACRFAISLLSGHEGGANMLAWDVAAALGSIPVITTATETNRRTTIGIGCRLGVTSEEVRQAVLEALSRAGMTLEDVRTAATVDLKRGEQGLIEGVRSLGVPLIFFSIDEINRFGGEFEPSKAAVRQLEVKAVAEPCALLAAGVAGLPSGLPAGEGRTHDSFGGRNVRLVLPKTVSSDRKITVAAARETEGEV